jgi:hypothetical protein
MCGVLVPRPNLITERDVQQHGARRSQGQKGAPLLTCNENVSTDIDFAALQQYDNSCMSMLTLPATAFSVWESVQHL